MTQLIAILTNLVKSPQFKIIGTILIVVFITYMIYSTYREYIMSKLQMKELRQRIVLNERAIKQG